MKTRPIKTLKLFSGAFNISVQEVKHLCNLAFKEGQSSPKIKPLNWKFHGIYYSAQTAFGTYILEENEENENMCDLYFGNLLLYSNIPVNEAKYTAQQNLEKKMKQHLM